MSLNSGGLYWLSAVIEQCRSATYIFSSCTMPLYATAMQIRKLSVKQIVSPIVFDNLRNAVPGGLYDPAMGPLEHSGQCSTCKQGYMACPGHFGHIELAVPVYNPLVFTTLFKLLRCTCLHCYRLKLAQAEVRRAACATSFSRVVGAACSRGVQLPSLARVLACGANAALLLQMAGEARVSWLITHGSLHPPWSPAHNACMHVPMRAGGPVPATAAAAGRGAPSGGHAHRHWWDQRHR